MQFQEGEEQNRQIAKLFGSPENMVSNSLSKYFLMIPLSGSRRQDGRCSKWRAG
jgi:hypothetical protein